MTPNSIDRAQRLLRTLGWPFGDWWVDGVWTVYANWDADKIVTRAHPAIGSLGRGATPSRNRPAVLVAGCVPAK